MPGPAPLPENVFLLHIDVLDPVRPPAGRDDMVSRRRFSRQETAVRHHTPPETIIDLVHGLRGKQLLALILEERQLFGLVFQIAQGYAQQPDRLFQFDGFQDGEARRHSG